MSGYEEKEYGRREYAGAPAGGYGTGEGLGQKITRKAGEAWEGIKEATPGTAEHRATHGTGTQYGTGAATGGYAPTAGVTTTTGPTGTTYGHAFREGQGQQMAGGGAPMSGTGEGIGHKVTRKAGEAWEGVKEAVPGTAEHRATHGTAGTGAGTLTGTAGSTEEYRHTGRTGI